MISFSINDIGLGVTTFLVNERESPGIRSTSLSATVKCIGLVLGLIAMCLVVIVKITMVRYAAEGEAEAEGDRDRLGLRLALAE